MLLQGLSVLLHPLCEMLSLLPVHIPPLASPLELRVSLETHQLHHCPLLPAGKGSSQAATQRPANALSHQDITQNYTSSCRQG